MEVARHAVAGNPIAMSEQERPLITGLGRTRANRFNPWLPPRDGTSGAMQATSPTFSDGRQGRHAADRPMGMLTSNGIAASRKFDDRARDQAVIYPNASQLA